jgi:sigma54-dependent transcription regulator
LNSQGGTIFLDDIDDVPLAMQVKLLRVLQNRTIERLGGTRQIPIDVRVITGSKRDLRGLVGEGKFRDDLFYRLNVIPVNLPPLRDRREDVPLLVDHFVKRYFRQRGEDVRAISPAVMQAFLRTRGPATCASSRTRASASPRPARATPCGSGAFPSACCSTSTPRTTSRSSRPTATRAPCRSTIASARSNPI